MSDYRQRRKIWQDVSGSITIVAATDWTAGNEHEFVAAKTGYTIFVQKITVEVTTDNAATLTFEDNASTPILAAKTKASPGLGPLPPFDFGEEGFALTVSKKFQALMSAAGLAASITWEAYRRPTSTLTPDQV